jgi:hypothetical protein
VKRRQLDAKKLSKFDPSIKSTNEKSKKIKKGRKKRAGRRKSKLV